MDQAPVHTERTQLYSLFRLCRGNISVLQVCGYLPLLSPGVSGHGVCHAQLSAHLHWGRSRLIWGGRGDVGRCDDSRGVAQSAVCHLDRGCKHKCLQQDQCCFTLYISEGWGLSAVYIFRCSESLRGQQGIRVRGQGSMPSNTSPHTLNAWLFST